MKNKKNNRSPPTPPTNPSLLQPVPHPQYTFVPPPHIPFYPPPWSAFPGAWPVPSHPGPPPTGFPLAMPPAPNSHPESVVLPPPNVGPGRPPSGHPIPHPFGLWPPLPGSFPPPPPLMMGPIISPTTGQSQLIPPPTSTQGMVVPPTTLRGPVTSAPPDQPSQPAPPPPLRRRPVTRRSAAQDRATSNTSSLLPGQPVEPISPSSAASKGSQTRRVKSQKCKDKGQDLNPDQDKVEANAAIVDERTQVDVKESFKEDVVVTAETSGGREDDNVSLPKLGSEPFIGLRFSSEDEAYEFYNAYAKEKGFSIRKSHIQRSRVDRSVISREYVCANQGFRSTNDRRYKGKVVRPRRETRVDCRATMSIKRRSGKWVVDKFHKEHNHGLVDPAKAEKLRSHRKITQTTKSVIDTLYKCRIGPSKIIDVLTKAAAGENTVEITSLDLMKYVKKKRKNNIAVDCYKMLEYFQRIQAVDPGFFYAVEVGENRSMRSIFWADSRAREAYKLFGDVLVFDNVCRTNKDLFPFVSFIGMNHHRQPVLFGCGLLADETVESFVWIFETLSKAMSISHPISVITSQDKAIAIAIEKVFPKTRQRFCMCDIEKTIRENLSDVHPDFQEEYKSCIYNSQNPEEFESGWKELVVKYNLKENSWLNGMYDQRQFWVPLYLKNTFFAGMSTTQLAEGMNSYFDGFLHQGTPLHEFVQQYEQAVERRREEETDEEIMTMYTSAGSTSKNPIEEQAAKVYTRNMFTMFAQEFFESSGCIARKISSEDEECTSKYEVGKYNSDKDDEMKIVTFNSIDNSVYCSCQMFEFEGILCKHVLKVFQDVNVIEIPAKYILKRWTMSARYAGSCSNEAEEGVSTIDPTTAAANVWTLKETAVKFVEFGATSAERINAAVNIIEEGMKKISLVNEQPVNDLPSEDLVDVSDQGEKLNDTATSSDPQPVKIKDRQQASIKTKLGVKQAQKRKRKCSTCKKTGHYTSTCPEGPVDQSQISTSVAGTS